MAAGRRVYNGTERAEHVSCSSGESPDGTSLSVDMRQRSKAEVVQKVMSGVVVTARDLCRHAYTSARED
jgi:hypothetical protein